MVEVSSNASGRCPVAAFENAGGTRAPLSGYDELDVLRRQAAVFQVEDGNGFVFQQGKGFLMITRYEEILEIAQNPEVWSNNVNQFVEDGPSDLIPEELDGEIHRQWRKLLAPEFAPGTVRRLEGLMRTKVNDLIDTFIEDGECDLVTQFARQFPTSIFLRLMGMPEDNLDEFVSWNQAILHPDPTDMQNVFVTQQRVVEYFRSVIDGKRASGAELGDDGLIGKAMTWTIDGEKISDENLLSFCLLMFQAGLDTVTAELGYSFHHLATHPADRERVVRDPDIIPRAAEEMMRAYGMVAPPRIATEDTMIGGCPVTKGERVALSFPSGSRDESIFPDGTTVDFDRKKMSHMGFGAGPHRCLGSNLARLQMIIAIQEWHRRIPEYRLVPGAHFDEDVSELFGLNALPLTWNR